MDLPAKREKGGDKEKYMKRILLSLLTVGAVGALAFGASQAFFSDTETSTGNTFTAGELDLQVDNTCHYWTNADADEDFEDVGCPLSSSWTLTDLGATHKFFDFADIKPGDYGEDTVSLHVENDAWLRLVIDGLVNNDNTCTEPEDVVDELGIPLPTPGACGTDAGGGELQQKLLFTMWLDEGVTNGFQGPQDLSECDNDYIAEFEPTIISEGPIDTNGETWNLSDFSGAYLLANQTACFGIAWRLPSTVGNEVQTDSFVGNMTFQVQQHRNNPIPTW